MLSFHKNVAFKDPILLRAPCPLQDRKFLLVGAIKYDTEYVTFSVNNSPHKRHASDDHVFVDVAILDFRIVPIEQNRTRVTFTFLGEFGGWIHPFVKTII